MDGDLVTLTRRELYDLVWSTPMATLCQDYGLSGVGMAKACRRHRVPCPPRGYWAQKRAGKPVRRAPLPRSAGPAVETVEFRRVPSPPHRGQARPPRPLTPTSPPPLSGRGRCPQSR